MKQAIETIRKIGVELMLLADQLGREDADQTPEVVETTNEATTAETDDQTQQVEETTDKSVVSVPAEISLADVRSTLAEISREGKTAEMKALLSKYGATKLSDIGPANYAALIAEAEEIRNA